MKTFKDVSTIEVQSNTPFLLALAFILFLIAFMFLIPTGSFAQSQRNPCYYTTANPGPGNGCIPVSSTNPLPVTGGGGGGGLSVLDNSAWTNNISNFTPNGGVFNDSATALSSGNQGTVRLNANREMHITCDIGNVLCNLINSATPGGTNRIGYVSDDPCSQKIKLNAPFSTSSGGPVSLIALSGSTVIYVCSISAITDTAIKLSFIDGTGGSCAAAQHAIWGSTTAASGMSLAANGGFTQGSGNGSVGVTTAASALCLLQSGTSLVAGNVTYVQQ